MKYLMVKRCEATYAIDEGLYAVVHGLDLPQYPDIARLRETVRCEEPLGHKGPGHHGSEDDAERHQFAWAGWGQP